MREIGNYLRANCWRGRSWMSPRAKYWGELEPLRPHKVDAYGWVESRSRTKTVAKCQTVLLSLTWNLPLPAVVTNVFDFMAFRRCNGRVVRLGQGCGRHQIFLHARAARQRRFRFSTSQLADRSHWRRNVGRTPGCCGRDGIRWVLGQRKKLFVKVKLWIFELKNAGYRHWQIFVIDLLLWYRLLDYSIFSIKCWFITRSSSLFACSDSSVLIYWPDKREILLAFFSFLQ